MKSKFWLFGGIAVVMVWACWSEYGKGYSEDQRRNWNEVVSEIIPKNQFASTSSDGFLEKRKKQGGAPVWSIDFSTRCQKDIPMEGMLVSSLKRLADQWNGDACLEIAFRRSHRVFLLQEDSSLFERISVVYDVERYLKKAEQFKRPGVDFLLRWFERQKKGDSVKIREISGYQEFLSCLDQGDFMLGKVYLYIDPEGDVELNRLAVALKEKASRGDVVALRDLGHLELLRINRGSPWSRWYKYYVDLFLHNRDRGVEEWLEKYVNPFFEKLPFQMSLIEAQGKLVKWLETQSRKEALKRLDVPIDRLWDAAKLGDLHAKYLWVQYAVAGLHVFSRQEWEQYFSYVDELAKKGGEYSLRVSNCYECPEYFYYDERSLEEIKKKSMEMSMRDNSASRQSSENSNVARMDMIASENGMSFFTNGYAVKWYGDITCTRDDEIYACYLISKAAEEGDPYAMLFLAVLLDKGSVLKRDVTRAWELLGKVRKYYDGIRCRESQDWFTHYVIGSQNIVNTFDDAVTWQMLDCVSRNGDMPGMTVDQAFELFLKEFNREAYESNHQKELKILKEQFEKRGITIPPPSE